MSKLISLEDALREHLKPAMTIHLTTQSRAISRAIQRVFRDQDLALTLVMLRIGGGHAGDLVASGLVKKVVTGSYGAVSRHYTGPLAQIQRSFAENKVEFESWTFWSLMQRLIAGAQGLPFLPTLSLRDSTIAKNNARDYLEIPDPFDPLKSVGLVKALRPDLAFLHVIAADVDGNSIIVPPTEDGAWGAKASLNGAIITTENIVDRQFIIEHSHLVRLPARLVKAVCHVPFGAHPGTLHNTALSRFGGYSEDEDFNKAYFAASRDPRSLGRWLDEWIYDVRSHENYLDKLGRDRLASLQSYPQRTKEAAELPSTPSPSKGSKKASANELVMTLALRYLLKRIAESDIDMILVGAGLSEVPGTAAYVTLKNSDRRISLMMGHGYFGFEPRSGRSDPDASTATLTTDPAEIYGVFLGGSGHRAIALLGAAQVDRNANLNSTLIKGELFVGSGGSNDAASSCETIVVTRATKDRLVNQVDYITAPGTNVRAVITEKAVFEKAIGKSQLALTQVYHSTDVSDAEALSDVLNSCGWDVDCVSPLKRQPPPTEEELETIRRFMPDRYN